MPRLGLCGQAFLNFKDSASAPGTPDPAGATRYAVRAGARRASRVGPRLRVEVSRRASCSQGSGSGPPRCPGEDKHTGVGRKAAQRCLWMLAQHCPELSCLCVRNWFSLEKVGLPVLTSRSSFPKLRHLALTGCDLISSYEDPAGKFHEPGFRRPARFSVPPLSRVFRRRSFEGAARGGSYSGREAPRKALRRMARKAKAGAAWPARYDLMLRRASGRQPVGETLGSPMERSRIPSESFQQTTEGGPAHG